MGLFPKGRKGTGRPGFFLVSVLTIYTLDCVSSARPELEDAILSLPGSELEVNVWYPDKYHPSTGREGFSCKFSEKGRAGTLNTGGSRIDVSPSLDALGHEMEHWINFMLYGETHDEDPNDLSNICNIPSYCHLYSESRNLLPAGSEFTD